MRQVYLDYSATTPVKEAVLTEMLPYFREHYGNPSSLYSQGFVARDALEQARCRVAQLIGAEPAEIFFTSGGTEADNWAVTATAQALRKKGNHIITTAIEHHALLHTCAALEQEGFRITYLEADRLGRIEPEKVRAAVTDQTILISVMFANNEVGTIQPIAEISQIARQHGVRFHTDAVQALGNLPISVNDLAVDLLALSAHKIYGPKGVGALYIRDGIELPNLLHGGGQEKRRRAGTENLPGIVGFGKACELAGLQLEQHIKDVTGLRNYFIEQLLAEVPDIAINGDLDRRLPGNVNVIFRHIEGEAMLLDLETKGIAASTGSACSSASFAPSHVLLAMGLPIEKVYSSLRFTVGDFTTKDDIDYAVAIIRDTVKRLRSFSPFC